ncbi:MAG: nitronate monooxygenase [Chloroflexota bacterium]|nr:nitronate monooxygenase [Chloroflexota bacterium]
MIRTPITELLGIEHPIIQAGMGSVAGSELAAAVCNAGGLGVLGAAFWPPDQLRSEIRRVKSLTDKPYAVDLLVAEGAPGMEELLKVIFDEQVPVFISGLGSPGAVVSEMHRRGMKVLAMVGTVRHARRCVDAGVDAVVAQGTEAGGHTGRVATFPLVPAVVDAVRPVPVAAAGGIADGRGLVAALALGASAAVVGTRFVATREAHGHEAYKQRIVAASEEDTVVTKVYTGKSCRVIPNGYIDGWAGREGEVERFPAQLLKNWAHMEAAIEGGDTDTGIMPAGQISGVVRSVESAGDIVRRMMAEAEAIITGLASARLTAAGKG